MDHFVRVFIRNPQRQYLLVHTIKDGRNRWELRREGVACGGHPERGVASEAV